MWTKFGLLIDFDLLKAAISTDAKPEIVLLRFGRHIALSSWRPLKTIMLAKPLAARTYLSSIVSELYDAQVNA